MSRHVNQVDKNRYVAYGYDHATGYFLDIFDKEKGDEENDYLVKQNCSTFTNMSNNEMIVFMGGYNINKEHIDFVVLDLPIP